MEELNLVNFECPEPFLKASAKLMSMKSGSLKIIFNDPKCDEMIMDVLKLMDCKILEHSENNGTFTIIVEKGEESNTKNVKLSGGC
ncbi:sulfurtransferase TusA family protein [Acidianus sulfidivorans JP7]|uniref:Sulfurtransferase TusA family protein n=1 Tax=Acidianus sulfidivorans JP7 TaxID=619593 RepID=A0A2U9IPE4_9CREN|nr:sulfurtransferase TusA family protein [Acidianus sulfidivorans]AWR97873.1 sulfurtransferase TusA family protein [Acidianus sulfidivorans JP7]